MGAKREQKEREEACSDWKSKHNGSQQRRYAESSWIDGSKIFLNIDEKSSHEIELGKHCRHNRP